MPGNLQFRPDRRAGPLFATALVILLGGIGVAVVGLASGQNPYVVLGIFAGVLVIVPLVGALFRVAPQRTLESLYGWMKSREQSPAENYQPRAVRDSRRYGTQRPPSVEEIKDLKIGTNNWVPSNAARKPKNPGPPQSGASPQG